MHKSCLIWLQLLWPLLILRVLLGIHRSFTQYLYGKHTAMLWAFDNHLLLLTFWLAEAAWVTGSPEPSPVSNWHRHPGQSTPTVSVSVPPLCYLVACERSWSFCQKCRWQVTAKHAYTLRMWLCMKWHGAWLYGIHRTCAEMAAVSCGTSHASAVITPLRWIFKKMRYKASHSCITTCEFSKSAQESRE